jgi:hypothetical protein
MILSSLFIKLIIPSILLRYLMSFLQTGEISRVRKLEIRMPVARKNDVTIHSETTATTTITTTT